MSHPSAASAASAVSDPIRSILDACKAERMGLCAAAEALLGAFKAEGLLYEATLPCMQVGFDPSNRAGEGGNAQEVHLLLQDIAMVGWSWAQTAHALCVEVTPGDKSVEIFNQKLCAGSGLAPVPGDSIHFGSLACGHTNMGLRAIYAGVPAVPADHPQLAEDGHYSLRKLEASSSDFAQAVRNGLFWRVLRFPVRSRYPEALPILQAVGGAIHSR
jgi:hypothetical protein